MRLQRTLVSIYEVDEQGATRQEVGQGSLVSPQVVLVHPPKSGHLAAEGPSKRFRVGITGPLGEASLDAHEVGPIEIIDVEGEPQVLWNGESTDQMLVGVDLSTPARTPVYEIPGLAADDPAEEAFRKTAEHLERLSETDPTSGAPVPFRSGDQADLPRLDNAWWCLMFPGKCKERSSK